MKSKEQEEDTSIRSTSKQKSIAEKGEFCLIIFTLELWKDFMAFKDFHLFYYLCWKEKSDLFMFQQYHYKFVSKIKSSFSL